MSTSDQQLPQALSVSHGRGLQLFGCVAMPIGCFVSTMFLLVGGGMFYAMGIRPVAAMIAAQSWTEVPCTILPRPPQGPQLQYEYFVQGARFVGDRYSFSEMEGSGPSDAQLANEYPPGKATVCYVDPTRPDVSVLHRGFVPAMLWGLFPLPFLLIGLGGHVLLLTLWRRRNVASRAESRVDDLEPAISGERQAAVAPRVVSIKELANSDYDDEDLREEPGPVQLTAESTPWGCFMGSLIFALIWNGVVGSFIAGRLSDWMQGRWTWFPELILIPFAVVGLVLIGVMFYAFLALFNPVPSLTLSRRLIPLGGTADLTWSFQGNTSSIRRLKLVLKGVEEARYTRGTDTHTDTETFYEETFFETDDSGEIAGGRAMVAVPTDTMHSFNGANNKIKWTIRIEGEIPSWPDIGAAFPIQVVPHE